MSLLHRFTKQVEFASTDNYSPLYAAMWQCFVDWLSAEDAADDPIVQWLEKEATANVDPFRVPLLMMAGLHAAVLYKDPAVKKLSAYYPTAVGAAEAKPADDQLKPILRDAVLALRNPLTSVIQTWMVQTNETGRGSVWLLPVIEAGFEEIDCIDLGASAGLNLMADYRRFDFMSTNGDHLTSIGRGTHPQFITRCSGQIERLSTLNSQLIPKVIHRVGCDLLPFPLNDPAEEIKLMAYVWGDQVDRIERLKEGIDALNTLRASGRDITLLGLRLPQELPPFLDQLHHTLPDHPTTDRPLILYNTFITQYFKSEAPALRKSIDSWAQTQSRPILWAQWEPVRDADAHQTGDQPKFGWLAWTVDRWENGAHTQEQLAWVHPHGQNCRFI